MQICTNCHSKQLDGTIFCTECGATMLAPRHQETTAALGQPEPSDISVPPAPAYVPAPLPERTGTTLTLVVMNSGRRIKLDVSEDLLIGRADDARGIFPDVDLSHEGGYDAGVSRRHAILSSKEGAFMVEDLGSANGTYVNGQRLTPQMPKQLAHGDELKCGTLLIRVEFT